MYSSELETILKRTWASSLALFKPKQLLVFLFSSGKTFMRTLMLVSIYYWWLLLFALLIQIASPGTSSVNWFVGLLLSSALILVCVLAARPSIERKDLAYFVKYALKSEEHAVATIICYSLIYILFFYLIPLYPVNYILLLFLLDMRTYADIMEHLQAIDRTIRKAFVFSFYFLPALSILWLCSIIINFFLANILFLLSFLRLPTWLFSCIEFISTYLVTVLLLSLIVSTYVTLKHGYAKLFITRTEKEN